MTKASDNQFPSVLMVNTSNASVGTPSPWNAQRLFFDADGSLKRIDSGDNVSAVEGGGSITFGGVSSTDTVNVASNFAVSDQGGGTARLDVFFPASGGGSGATVGACAQNDGTQSFTHNTWADFTLDTEVFDTDGFFSLGGGNPERATIPAGLGGTYLLQGKTKWDDGSAGAFKVAFYKNDSDYLRVRRDEGHGHTADWTQELDHIVELEAGDFVTFRSEQETGSSVLAGDAISSFYRTEFSLIRLGT